MNTIYVFFISTLLVAVSCNSLDFSNLDRDNPCDLKGNNPQITGRPIPNFSYQIDGFFVKFINNSTNSTEYEWNLGVGNDLVFETSPSFDYPVSTGIGNFTVSLSALNYCEVVTITRSIILNCPNAPEANFTYFANELTLSFQNMSINAASLTWNFGDGTETTESSPMHTYSNYGTYNVTLAARNNCGEVFISVPVTVSNCEPLPTTQFSIEVVDELTVIFSNNSYNALYFSWNFGDGTSSTEFSPSHSYAKSGTYTVVLSASNVCTSQTLSQTVTVCIPILFDERDGKSYKIVRIGNQCWMAQNLNTGSQVNSLVYGGGIELTEFCLGDLHPDLLNDDEYIEKYCYENTPFNCSLNGGLYTWNEAMNYEATNKPKGICPQGWHIPTDGEWKRLEKYLGMSEQLLNAEGYRETNQEGLQLRNPDGFNAKFCGYRYYNGDFLFTNSIIVFWTSTESSDSCKSWIRYLDMNSQAIYRSYDVGDKNYGYCIRCLND